MLENLFGNAEVNKMFIQAVTVDNKGKITPSPDENLKFSVQVNPESYSLNYRIKYNYNPGSGDSGSEAKHACTAPRVLTFEFLFDGTGVIPKSGGPLDGVPLAGAIAGAISDLLGGDEEDDVESQLKKFVKVVDYTGDIHKPHTLQLVWGKFVFVCVLTSLTIDYKLFNLDGVPLRAIAKATFSEFQTDALRKLLDQDSSPDLTHLRQIAEGDKLPLMANKIYRTPNYYIQVAQANKLYNFRSLKAGAKLSFPPIDKKAK